WARVKVTGVPLSLYTGYKEGLEVFKDHLEGDGYTITHHLPIRWMATEQGMQERIDNGAKVCAVVITTTQKQANEIVSSGVSAGGKRFKCAVVIDVDETTQCARCCAFGHAAFSCTDDER